MWYNKKKDFTIFGPEMSTFPRLILRQKLIVLHNNIHLGDKVMVKRSVAVFLAFIVCLGLIPAAMAGDQKPLVISNSTKMNGSFFTQQWGDNTVDVDLRFLLHGNALTVFDNQQECLVNPTVVASIDSLEKADATEYTVTLKPELLWSDASPLTAKDYVFSILLQASPALRALGGSPMDFSYILGFEDYASGKTTSFLGLRLLDTLKFSVSIKKEALTRFFLNELLNIYPYPAALLAAEAQVLDAEEGAKLEPALEETKVREAILNPETGYASHPAVNCGPYTLSAYDREKGVADFVLNPHFAGDYKGQKPTIPALRVIQADQDKALDALRAGQINIINKLSVGQTMLKASKLTKFGQEAYARRGYLYFAFDFNDPVTSSLAVRQALSMSLNKMALAREYLQGYGTQVYGDYGLGQWTAAAEAQAPYLKGVPQDPKAFASYNEFPYEKYPLDLNKAVQTLVDDAWTLNEKGEAFRKGKDKLRYKKTDSGLIPLELRWLSAKDSKLVAFMQKKLKPQCEKLGISLKQTEVGQNEFFESYYGRDPKGYNLYLLGSNYAESYHAYPRLMNAFSMAYSIGQKDAKLLSLAQQLEQTPQGDKAEYLNRFMAYQEYYSAVLPTLPLFGQVYLDVFDPMLSNYHPGNHASFAQAILYTLYTPTK